MSLNLTVPLESLGKLLFTGALFFTLTGAGIVLARLNYQYDHVYGLYNLLDLDSDSSIPTWFSSFGLLVCSVLLWVHSRLEDRTRRVARWQWLFLAIVFLLMSIDEIGKIHEVLGSFVGHELVPDVSQKSGGILNFQWLVVGVGFTVLVGFAYIPFLYRLPRRFALGFMLAGAVYVGGAAVMESFNGHTAHSIGSRSAQYLWGTEFEEFLEMTGVALFAQVLVRYLASRLESISLTSNFGQDASCADSVSDMAFGSPASATSLY